MKLSEVHQELLTSIYPDGYVVPEGEEGHVHVMFVDIVGGGKGKIGHRVANFQKYFPAEWQKIKAVIDNPVYGIVVTGHNEYSVVYDPAEYEAALKKAKEAKPGKAEKEVKPEEKPKPGPKPKTPQK